MSGSLKFCWSNLSVTEHQSADEAQHSAMQHGVFSAKVVFILKLLSGEELPVVTKGFAPCCHYLWTWKAPGL